MQKLRLNIYVTLLKITQMSV